MFQEQGQQLYGIHMIGGKTPLSGLLAVGIVHPPRSAIKERHIPHNQGNVVVVVLDAADKGVPSFHVLSVSALLPLQYVGATPRLLRPRDGLPRRAPLPRTKRRLPPSRRHTENEPTRL